MGDTQKKAIEEGKEVGLTFFAEDIHVMEKMGF